ncbi:hypothetical protein [Parasphingorhabdus sp.]|uniref:hypothetical protein n=1 Tax=Parasphingorhabdus sp. TaxID=2709688 RepID=UPI003A8E809F
MADKLIERLETYAEDWRTRAANVAVVHEAAQAIAALTAERDALREALEEIKCFDNSRPLGLSKVKDIARAALKKESANG